MITMFVPNNPTEQFVIRKNTVRAILESMNYIILN